MIKVLFVCLGNICRSPTAEGVFRKLVEEHGVSDEFEIDSAGTSGYHIGEAPDPRAIQAAKARGYDLTNIRGRQVSISDFDYFDIILAMDHANFEALMANATNASQSKVKLLLDFAKDVRENEVPDPYYGGEKGFDHVINLIESASDGLLNDLLEKREA